MGVSSLIVTDAIPDPPSVVERLFTLRRIRWPCVFGRHRPAYRPREDHMADTYEGYCVKCKEKRTFDGEVRVSDSGRRMAQGICPVCGTKMNRILGKA
jgi:hypothetical protein